MMPAINLYFRHCNLRASFDVIIATRASARERADNGSEGHVRELRSIQEERFKSSFPPERLKGNQYRIVGIYIQFFRIELKLKTT